MERIFKIYNNIINFINDNDNLSLTFYQDIINITKSDDIETLDIKCINSVNKIEFLIELNLKTNQLVLSYNDIKNHYQLTQRSLTKLADELLCQVKTTKI